MRIVSFRRASRFSFGLLRNDEIVDIGARLGRAYAEAGPGPFDIVTRVKGEARQRDSTARMSPQSIWLPAISWRSSARRSGY